MHFAAAAQVLLWFEVQLSAFSHQLSAPFVDELDVQVSHGKS
jgi:hypothetical protein